jgi:8-oxo-dGTP pyrophosphatase MutT (NUDIX family)
VTDRIRLDDLTSDDLDRLYAERDRHAATLNRVRDLRDDLHGITGARWIAAALDHILDGEQPTPAPAATRATELVDLVDPHGHTQLTHIPRTRADHHPGLHLPIVLVVITHADGRVLVHQRAARKSQPYAIDHVCGAIRSGETPDAAAHRETREETGATLDTLRLVTAGINGYGRYRYLYAATTSTPEDALAGDPAEVAWVGYEQVDILRGRRELVAGFLQDLDAALVDDGPALVTDPAHLRQVYAAAIRTAACTGQCGLTEEQCDAQHVQAVAWHDGVLVEVSGTPEVLASVVAAVRDRHVGQLQQRLTLASADLHAVGEQPGPA